MAAGKAKKARRLASVKPDTKPQLGATMAATLAPSLRRDADTIYPQNEKPQTFDTKDVVETFSSGLYSSEIVPPVHVFLWRPYRRLSFSMASPVGTRGPTVLELVRFGWHCDVFLGPVPLIKCGLLLTYAAAVLTALWLR